MSEQIGNLSRKMETIKKNQGKFVNWKLQLLKWKINWKGFREDWDVRRVSEFEKRSIEIIQPWEQSGGKLKKNEQSLKDKWDNIKQSNIEGQK